MLALKDRLNDAISCDSLTFGGNALQSLLARNVKDRCINSRLKGGKSSLVLLGTVHFLWGRGRWWDLEECNLKIV